MEGAGGVLAEARVFPSVGLREFVEEEEEEVSQRLVWDEFEVGSFPLSVSSVCKEGAVGRLVVLPGAATHAFIPWRRAAFIL